MWFGKHDKSHRIARRNFYIYWFCLKLSKVSVKIYISDNYVLLHEFIIISIQFSWLPPLLPSIRKKPPDSISLFLWTERLTDCEIPDISGYSPSRCHMPIADCIDSLINLASNSNCSAKEVMRQQAADDDARVMACRGVTYIEKLAPTQLRVLSLQAVEEKTGMGGTLIYELMKTGDFPQSLRITSRKVGWLEHEVDSWLLARPWGTAG